MWFDKMVFDKKVSDKMVHYINVIWQNGSWQNVSWQNGSCHDGSWQNGSQWNGNWKIVPDTMVVDKIPSQATWNNLLCNTELFIQMWNFSKFHFNKTVKL